MARLPLFCGSGKNCTERFICMVIGQNKCGDVMKVVCKGAALAAVGLAAAIIVYPFTHELGHVIAVRLSGGQICEFHLFPIPNVLCKFDSTDMMSMILAGFGGVLFPLVVTGIHPPKPFLLWYLWLSVKGICVWSLLLSLWELVFFQTELEIVNDDIAQVLRFAPEYRAVYFAVIIAALTITAMQLARSRPLDKCMEYFNM